MLKSNQDKIKQRNIEKTVFTFLEAFSFYFILFFLNSWNVKKDLKITVFSREKKKLIKK